MEPDDRPAEHSSPNIQCDDCKAALESGGRQAVSFLLIETLTVPLVGCDAHLEQFRALCGLSTDESAKLLSHLPAGGIQCPGCRQSHHSIGMPVVMIEGGAVGIRTCSDHAEAVLDRYQSGLDVRQQIGADV